MARSAQSFTTFIAFTVFFAFRSLPIRGQFSTSSSKYEVSSCNALKKKPEKGLMKESRVLMLISCVTVHLIDRRSNSCCPNVSCKRATMRRVDSTDRTTSGKRQIPQMTTKRREVFLLLFPKQQWQLDLLFLVHHIGLEGFFHRHE